MDRKCDCKCAPMTMCMPCMPVMPCCCGNGGGGEPDPGRYVTHGGGYELIVATDGDDATADGTEALPFATIEGAIAEVEKRSRLITSETKIRFKPGVYTTSSTYLLQGIFGDGLWLESFSGARDVSILYNGPGDIGEYMFRISGLLCGFVNLTLGGQDTAHRIGTVICTATGGCVPVRNCVVQHARLGLYSYGLIYTDGTQISNTADAAVLARCGGVVSSRNSGGGSNTGIGLYADGGMIYKSGTQPSATTAEQKVHGGQIFG